MEKVNIQIDPDLHAELRDYCDSCGIRFMDFVEDALEQAIRFEEVLDKSEKADQVLNQASIRYAEIIPPWISCRSRYRGFSGPRTVGLQQR